MEIGFGPKEPVEDIVGLLQACHGRIRRFIGMARRIAEANAPAEDELRAAAAQVHRYFAEALPLHVEDEEQTVLPRLRGIDPALDASLERMHHEHGEHGPDLARLLDILQALDAAPARHDALKHDLAQISARLERDLEAHLVAEESVVLPAIREHLDEQVRREMVQELRARRTV